MKPLPPEEPKAFLSYAREDMAAAEKLYWDLRHRGIDVWWDEESLFPGQDWEREIRLAIRSCDWFLAVISNNSVSKRGVVQKELRYALSTLEEFPEGSNFLIPIRLEDCKPPFEKVSERHWVDMFPDWNTGLKKLLRVWGIDRSPSQDPNERFSQAMELFRHGLLGPAQGIVSAARVLGDRARANSPKDDTIGELVDRIDIEAEQIRLWRENYRYLQADTLTFHKQKIPLRPLVSRVVERFAPWFRRRDIAFEIQWMPRSEIVLQADQQALDVALSNLVCNTAKYSLHRRTSSLVIALDLETEMLKLSVENVGTPFSLKALEKLRSKQQLEIDDFPESVLEGHGLGLKVARKIAEAHGGSLEATSEPESSSSNPNSPTAAVRVNFQIPIASRDSPI